jgi:hypothetical protein
MDDDVVHDLKVQGLPDALFKAWINILCITSKNKGRLPSLDATAFALRVDAAKATEILVKLVQAGLIDRNDDGHAPHNWDGRQFLTDNETSTKRSQKHRAKLKAEQSGTVSGNNDATLQYNDATLQQPLPPLLQQPLQQPHQSTETETETEAKTEAKKGRTREVALVPPGWPDNSFDQFWAKYPNKVDRAGAVKSLSRAGSKGIEWPTIMAGLERYIAKTDDRPWCNPTTWINQSRWDDQPATVSPNNGKAKTGGSIVTALNELSDHFQREVDAERAAAGDLEACGDDVLGLPAE